VRPCSAHHFALGNSALQHRRDFSLSTIQKQLDRDFV
jgi:hypothetical protein